MKKILIIICTVIVCSMADIKQVNEIKILSTDILGRKYNTSESREIPAYVDRWFQILQGAPLEFILKDINVIPKNFTCKTQQYSIDINFSLRDKPIDGVTTFYLPTVTDKMSDIWVCRVPSPDGQDFNFTVKVYVNDAKPAHQLLINRTRPDAVKRGNTFNSEYFYQNGDKMVVECIGLLYKCTVQITDSVLRVVDGGNRGKDVWGRGYKMTLQEADNGREVTCISNCSGLITTEKLTFQLQKESDNIIKIQINHNTLRRKNTQLGKKYYFQHAYVLYHTEALYAASTKQCDVELELSYENCLFQEGPTTSQNKRLLEGTVKVNIQSVLRFTAKSKMDDRILEEVVILFHPIKATDNSFIVLSPKLELNKKTIGEYYELGFQKKKEFIHYTYEYDDSEEFAIHCKKQSYAPPALYINVNNTALDKRKNDSYTHVILDETYNNTVFTCKLLDNDEKIITEIWVLFLSADRLPTYSIHYECHDASVGSGVILGIFIGVVVGSVPFAFLCKLKTRYNCKRKIENMKLKRKYAQNNYVHHTHETVAIKPVRQLVEDPIYHTPNVVPGSVKTQMLPQEIPEYDYACHPPVVKTPTTNENESTYTDMTHNQYVPCHL